MKLDVNDHMVMSVDEHVPPRTYTDVEGELVVETVMIKPGEYVLYTDKNRIYLQTASGLYRTPEIEHVGIMLRSGKTDTTIPWPCPIKRAINVMINGNTRVELWYYDKDGFQQIWEGEFGSIPDEYKNLKILRILGLVNCSGAIALEVDATSTTPKFLPSKPKVDPDRDNSHV